MEGTWIWDVIKKIYSNRKKIWLELDLYVYFLAFRALKSYQNCLGMILLRDFFLNVYAGKDKKKCECCFCVYIYRFA